LAEIPPSRIRQLPPQSAWLFPRWKSAPLIVDPAAAGGYAICKELGGQTFTAGYYDEIGKQQHGIRLAPESVTPGAYRLHRLAQTAFSPCGYLWFDSSWGINFAEVLEMYDPRHPDRTWEIWASLKFEGPAYGSPDLEKNLFYVDRVILVATEPPPAAEPAPAQKGSVQPEFDVAAPN
jgi:hypothetical protein